MMGTKLDQALSHAISDFTFIPLDFNWTNFQQQTLQAKSLESLLATLKNNEDQILHQYGDEAKETLIGFEYIKSAITLMQHELLPIDLNTLKEKIINYISNMAAIDSARQGTLECIKQLCQLIAMERIRKAPPDIVKPTAQESYFSKTELRAFTELSKDIQTLRPIKRLDWRQRLHSLLLPKQRVYQLNTFFSSKQRDEAELMQSSPLSPESTPESHPTSGGPSPRTPGFRR